jgi:hypothetical protein
VKARVVRIAVRVGLVTAAGTAGVLSGYDLRAGVPGRSFLLLGRGVLEGYRIAGSAAVVVGIGAHVCSVIVLSAPFVVIASRWRGTKVALAALVYATLVGFVVVRALPAVVRPGYASGANGPQLVVWYAVFAMCVAIGTRIARSLDQPAVQAFPGDLQRPPTSEAREGGTGE